MHKEKPRYEFSKACGNLSVRCGSQNQYNLGRGSASRWSAPGPSQRTRREELRALLIVRDEFPGWLFLSGLLSSREPASASPTAPSMGWGITAGNELSANGNLSLVSVSQPRGSLHNNAQERGAVTLIRGASIVPVLRFSTKSHYSRGRPHIPCSNHTLSGVLPVSLRC